MLPETIDDLLALADPSPGSTACVRHDLPAFADLEPRLITLSAREGEITFIEDFGTDVGSETVAQFHRSVAARLVRTGIVPCPPRYILGFPRGVWCAIVERNFLSVRRFSVRCVSGLIGADADDGS